MSNQVYAAPNTRYDFWRGTNIYKPSADANIAAATTVDPLPLQTTVADPVPTSRFTKSGNTIVIAADGMYSISAVVAMQCAAGVDMYVNVALKLTRAGVVQTTQAQQEGRFPGPGGGAVLNCTLNPSFVGYYKAGDIIAITVQNRAAASAVTYLEAGTFVHVTSL